MSNGDKVIFGNVEYGTSILHLREIETMLEIANFTICDCLTLTDNDATGTYPKQGTIIVDGQKYGCRAELVVRLHLSDGPIIPNPADDDSHTSDHFTVTSVNNILKYPRSQRLFFPKLNYSGTEEQVPIGYYHKDRYRVAVLNAELGRFLIGVDIEDNDPECYANARVIVALIDALVNLSPGDKQLMVSAETVRQEVVEDCGGILTQISIRDLFRRAMDGKGGPEEIVAWWSWYQRVRAEKIRNCGLIPDDDLEAETMERLHFE